MAERLKPESLLRALIHQQTSATVFLTSNVGLYLWLGASIPTSNVIQSSTADPRSPPGSCDFEGKAAQIPIKTLGLCFKCCIAGLLLVLHLQHPEVVALELWWLRKQLQQWLCWGMPLPSSWRAKKPHTHFLKHIFVRPCLTIVLCSHPCCS